MHIIRSFTVKPVSGRGTIESKVMPHKNASRSEERAMDKSVHIQRAPLNIVRSFLCHCPEIDGRALGQLDSIPDSEPETQSVFRGVRKKPPHSKTMEWREIQFKHRRERSCGLLPHR
ncbi:hypothetical protein TNCV_925861 [Trichonephila clavipes]|nr:hypothetical protein TNCV_925861 [Trichonephila clavipes]